MEEDRETIATCEYHFLSPSSLSFLIEYRDQADEITPGAVSGAHEHDGEGEAE